MAFKEFHCASKQNHLLARELIVLYPDRANLPSPYSGEKKINCMQIKLIVSQLPLQPSIYEGGYLRVGRGGGRGREPGTKRKA